MHCRGNNGVHLPLQFLGCLREAESKCQLLVWAASKKGPCDVVQGTDAERREMLERRGAERDAANLALSSGTGFDDLDSDRFLLVGHLQLAATHRIAVTRTASVK